ncbi:hypothetical protein BB559_003594 [Furculomyces boomerangus]|uniref:Uncharacterized protein n=2 Tax=Harpellales TaxID=61421 RepID=A0A2T9YKB2_9FUNG|nr:hypothetical protein BB559_003594 [Furculomyces boomerangus]PVZ96775.1 hypothetical protein BB558_007299 [Smittium angustum]
MSGKALNRDSTRSKNSDWLNTENDDSWEEINSKNISPADPRIDMLDKSVTISQGSRSFSEPESVEINTTELTSRLNEQLDSGIKELDSTKGKTEPKNTILSEQTSSDREFEENDDRNLGHSKDSSNIQKSNNDYKAEKNDKELTKSFSSDTFVPHDLKKLLLQC